MHRWETTEYDLDTEGSPRPSVTRMVGNVALTAVVKDSHITLMWSVNLKGATWPQAEEIGDAVAETVEMLVGTYADPDG